MTDRIEFRSDDNMLIRADKIWRVLGFVSDRMGAVPSIAGFLSLYQELDDKAREQAGATLRETPQ